MTSGRCTIFLSFYGRIDSETRKRDLRAIAAVHFSRESCAHGVCFLAGVHRALGNLIGFIIDSTMWLAKSLAVRTVP